MRIHIAQSNSSKASEVYQYLKHIPSFYAEDCDVVVVLGGDGFMLRCLHQFQHLNKPIFGINCGTIGFLMNDLGGFNINEKSFIKRIENAQATKLHPLKAETQTFCEERITEYAINEISLFRQTSQTAHLKININGTPQINPYMGDGIIIATPAGSTAYNRSAHGPIIPLKAPLMALTPICSIKPREWRGALLDNNVEVEIEVIHYNERPVSACADYINIPNIKRINIKTDFSISHTLMFDPVHNLEKRIINEQFV